MWWEYDELESGEPYDWMDHRGDRPDDQTDFHVDLGCGRVPKGRLGIDRFPNPGVKLVMNLDTLEVSRETPDTSGLYDPFMEGMTPEPPHDIPRLPFPDDSIKSIVSHHALEHVGPGFIRLMDECYRVLEPGGLFRIIVPLFPSHSAVSDPDHKRFFQAGTFITFCGTGQPGDETHWMDSFSTPYTKARFVMPEVRGSYANPDMSPPPDDARLIGTHADSREMRVSLFKP